MTTLYLILAGLVGFGLLVWLVAYLSGKRGRAEANSDGLESAVDHARKSGAIDEDVAKLPDADLYDELHNGGRK